MPKISQLPTAAAVTAYDAIPISQGGTARSASVGTILQSVQTAITIDSASLLGRVSLGAGAPEQVDIGTGLDLVDGTLCANGQDHAAFTASTSLPPHANLVISNQGTPMLMPATLLRGLFTPGQNVSITASGVISATAAGSADIGSAIGTLQVATKMAAQDLLPVSQSGTAKAISYANLLGGLTIDQAQAAGSVADTDTFWAGQGSNVMARQTFAALWTWMASKLPSYDVPVVEVTSDTALTATAHNGRILLCSQPVTVSPSVPAMGSGFTCTLINASSRDVTLGSGFVTSSGGTTLGPWQTAFVYCLTYSGGTVAFAALGGVSAGGAVPGAITALTASATGSTSISASWQAPTSGGAATSYVVGCRPTGTTNWTNSSPIVSGTSYQVTSLASATSYDIVVQAFNASGAGPFSNVMTVVTTMTSQATPPAQVTGLVATAISSSSIQLSWTGQTDANAATSYTVQYRASGATVWTALAGQTGVSATVSGLQASTAYDFQVFGVNGTGSGTASSTITATTSAAPHLVNTITWNLLPGGPYSHGTGAIGLNAHVSPASSAIQFGFSQSATVPPANWTVAVNVNTDLWGAYVPTPATAGNWYVWSEGTDGSSATVYATPFIVQ